MVKFYIFYLFIFVFIRFSYEQTNSIAAKSQQSKSFKNSYCKSTYVFEYGSNKFRTFEVNSINKM